MKKIAWLLTIVLVLVFAVSCGSSKKDEKEPEEISDSDSEPAETDGDAEEPAADDSDIETSDEEPVTPLACADFAEGLNENLIVGEGKNALERSFILRLPKNIDSNAKFPVIFLYHGYGDWAENFEGLLSPYVDNDEMPYILVVPEARGDIFAFDDVPPKGLDWDMINLGDGSAEAYMFDVILDCLEQKWSIDEKHIHVSGFSSGAITANSIALMRSDKVASILTYSGAYFSDKESLGILGEIMGMKVADFFSWPDFPETHKKYTQVFAFGRHDADKWSVGGFFSIDFNDMAILGSRYLVGLGHDAILCKHPYSHTVAGPLPFDMIKFFHDHPLGTEVSPYREAGLPGDLADCRFADGTEELEREEDDEPDEEPENPDEEPDETPETPDEEPLEPEDPVEDCFWLRCSH